MSERVKPIEFILKILYDQLDVAEEEAIKAQSRVSKLKYGQKNSDALLNDIRRYEERYVIELSHQIKRSDDLPEPIALTIVGELVDELELMGPIAKTDEMRSMVQQILAELQKPGVPAAAKLKVAIPLVRGIVAIELEGDAESVVRRLFPTFVRAYDVIKIIAGQWENIHYGSAQSCIINQSDQRIFLSGISGSYFNFNHFGRSVEYRDVDKTENDKRIAIREVLPDNLISYFLCAEMDSYVAIDRLTTLDVTLSPETIAQINEKTNKTGKIEIDPTKALILHVLPKVNFEIIGESRIEIDSSTLNATQTIYFDLKPTHLGDGEIWVVVRQSQLPILTLKLTPRILESKVNAQRLSIQGTIQSFPNFSEPPHILDIREQKNGDQISYQYELRSKSLNLWHRYDSKILNGDRKEYVNSLYKGIESRWVSTQGDAEAFTDELRAMGGELLDELFPDDLKRHLWEHRHELESIMVTSTEPFIPWELIHLKPSGQNHLPDETCFLGQLGLVRWLYDIGYPPETLTLRGDRCHYIIPHYPDSRYRLPQAEEEAHFLEQTFQATAIDPQPNPVRQALKM